MKIARNDVALAHALAKSTAGEQMHRDLAYLDGLKDRYTGKRTMKNAFRQMREIFKERVICELITRPHGSRAEGYLYILAPLTSGDLVLFLMAWMKSGIKQKSTPIYITRHALARMMQRTVGESDLPACVERLTPYVMVAVAEGLRRFPDYPKPQLSVAGMGGALIFQVQGKLLVAKTWMDAAMMADPKLRVDANDPDLITTWEDVPD